MFFKNRIDSPTPASFEKLNAVLFAGARVLQFSSQQRQVPLDKKTHVPDPVAVATTGHGSWPCHVKPEP
jgi:hypothetical protein